MPLSELQSRILVALAQHRNPESYVAGGSVLNRDGPRISQDIDIFHDREAAVAAAAAADVALLEADGYGIGWVHREPGLHAAVVSRNGEATRLEWARDSDFRFFATIRDAVFGYRLHLVDLATNKMLAAAGRREPRDILDLLHIHAHHLPLGAVVWAAVAKDPGFTPESLIAEVRRNSCYRADDFADLASNEPIDAGEVSRRIKASLAEAEHFVSSMPAGKEGLVFLQEGEGRRPRSRSPRLLRGDRRSPPRTLAVVARYRRGDDRSRAAHLIAQRSYRVEIASASARSAGVLMLRNGS